MELFTMLSEASILARLSLLVAVLPLVFGATYALRPSELRLALMRPISLAAIFGGLSGTFSGFINVLRAIWIRESPPDTQMLAVSTAEALVPLLVAFGALTIGWLCAAVGLRRHP